MKRSLIILLALISVLCILSSCGKKMPAEDTRTVAVVNGIYEVSADMYRYFYLNYLDSYTDAQKKDMTSQQLRDEIHEKVISSIKNVYASVLLGKEYGITPEDKTVQTEVDETYEESIKDYGTESEFIDALKESHMTLSVFRYLLSVDEVEAQTFSVLTTGTGVIETEPEKLAEIFRGDTFIRIKHVLISNTNGLSDEKNRETAEKVLKLAKAGEDFDKLVGSYSNDYSMSKDGYYFTYNYMLKELEEASFKLQVGEISDIVETKNGYHIIKRLEKDDDYLALNFTTLKAQYQSSVFYGMVDSYTDKVTVATNDIFESIDFGA